MDNNNNSWEDNSWNNNSNGSDNNSWNSSSNGSTSNNNDYNNDYYNNYNNYNYNQGQYYYQPNMQQPNMQKPTNGYIGISITSMVLGIISMTICCSIGWMPGVVGLIFGGVAISQNYDGRGMAIAGLVTSIIGTLIGAFALIMSFV